MSSGLVKVGVSAALAAGFLLQSILPAAAGELQDRMAMQQHRIHAGVAHHEISPRQARRDERRLAHIRYERNRDLRRNGGSLTPRERRHLNAELTQNARAIHRQR